MFTDFLNQTYTNLHMKLHTASLVMSSTGLASLLKLLFCIFLLYFPSAFCADLFDFLLPPHTFTLLSIDDKELTVVPVGMSM